MLLVVIKQTENVLHSEREYLRNNWREMTYPEKDKFVDLEVSFEKEMMSKCPAL